MGEGLSVRTASAGGGCAIFIATRTTFTGAGPEAGNRTPRSADAASFHLMYADQQDGNRVWIERVLYTDGLPGEVVPAHSSRLAVFDVWYDAPVGSPSEVPDDLVFDFGI